MASDVRSHLKICQSNKGGCVSILTRQAFQIISESRGYAEQELSRIIHWNCPPTKEDKECKCCEVAWDEEKAEYCTDSKAISTHHLNCYPNGLGWSDDDERGHIGKRADELIEIFDSLYKRIVEFDESFETCEQVPDDERHFQHRRTKRCSKCLKTRYEQYAD